MNTAVRRFGRVVTAVAFSLVALAAVAQDVSDLAGVQPGDVLDAVPRNTSNVRGNAPFFFFGIPTQSADLARYFPSGEAYVFPDGRIVGIRWKRAYSEEGECQQAVREVSEILTVYFPVPVTSDQAWRYQQQTSDMDLGVGISCDRNDGDYWEVEVELIHFELDRQLSEELYGA